MLGPPLRTLLRADTLAVVARLAAMARAVGRTPLVSGPLDQLNCISEPIGGKPIQTPAEFQGP